VVEQEVLQTVREMNRLWTEGDGSGLERYFHAQMVSIVPDRKERLEGGAACVAEWQGFARSAKTRLWRTSEEFVRVYGDAAVVAFVYEMECEFGGEVLRLRGRDLMTLVKEDGRWQIVADHFSPEPGMKG